MIAFQAPVRKSAAIPEPEPEAEPKRLGDLVLRIVRRLGREGGR